MLIAFHKPYGVLSQFTPELAGQRVLAEFNFPSQVYPVGRLDQDSEGLLLLTDEKPLVDRLLNPQRGHPRTYHVQVENIPSPQTLKTLEKGVIVQGKRTLPCRAHVLVPQPTYPPRHPPVRIRQSIPDTWLAITLTEGRNRQVRRMTAAMGHPTLRLIRAAVGTFSLAALAPGTWTELDPASRQQVLNQ
jgi:23S rRNA pseudouridine2457 synthase